MEPRDAAVVRHRADRSAAEVLERHAHVVVDHVVRRTGAHAEVVPRALDADAGGVARNEDVAHALVDLIGDDPHEVVGQALRAGGEALVAGHRPAVRRAPRRCGRQPAARGSAELRFGAHGVEQRRPLGRFAEDLRVELRGQRPGRGLQRVLGDGHRGDQGDRGVALPESEEDLDGLVAPRGRARRPAPPRMPSATLLRARPGSRARERRRRRRASGRAPRGPPSRLAREPASRRTSRRSAAATALTLGRPR